MHAWLPLALLFATPPSPETAIHKVVVHVAGPLAMVEVWRSVEANTRTVGEKQLGTFLDLDLPEGAALLDWDVSDGAGRTRLAPQTEVQASAGLAAALKLRRLSMPAATDESTDYRVHITPIADGEKAVLHFRYAAVVGCRAGQLVLRMPENLEENPVPAEVTVTLAPSPDGLTLAEASLSSRPADIRPGARPLVMRGTAPARAAWEIAWRYVRTPGSFAGQALAAAARVPRIDATNGRPKSVSQYELAGLLCRDDGPAKSALPARVLLLVDRSRSVGPGGVSAERALARGLVEALPPSVPFNAILFGVEATPVFALPRMPTREALEAFTNAADPNRLENGTDVTLALARARAMVDAGGDDGAEATWVVLITDGALPARQNAEGMRQALAGARERNLKVMVLLVRQQGDDEVPDSAIAEYAKFARKFGGLVRVIPQGNVGDTAGGILAAMARGGDWLDVRLDSAKLAEVLSPGSGASIAFNDPARLPKERRVRVSARGFDADVHIETQPALVKREWLDPLLDAVSGKRRAWAGASASMAIAILPSPASTNKPSDGVIRGRMDPTVLRNSLSLAFLPRARACYLSRRVAKTGDAYLRGRMKLELSIERGELHDAVVRSSTLGHPGIEDCVRSAAWAVEYPRPEHRDAPTTANVNLVFQPRTAQESPPDASPMDREIELILGPLTLTSDFTDLIESKVPDKSAGQ
jgi:hypothetical protein